MPCSRPPNPTNFTHANSNLTAHPWCKTCLTYAPTREVIKLLALTHDNVLECAHPGPVFVEYLELLDRATPAEYRHMTSSCLVTRALV